MTVMSVDLLVLQNPDHFIASLGTSHHSVCRHNRQVARSIISDWNRTLVWTDQLVIRGFQISSPGWTVAFNQR